MLVNNILKPIYDIQYGSDHVIRGWKQIRVHLNFWSMDTDQDAEIQLMNECIFIPRYRKEVMDVYVVAYLLHPPNYQVIDACLTLETHFARVLIRFFKQYEVDYLVALSQFYAFRAQTEDFNSESPCWACISDPVLFWQVCSLIFPFTLFKLLTSF